MSNAKKLRKIVLHFNKTQLLDLVGDFNLHPSGEYFLDFETAQICREGAFDWSRFDSPVELDPPLSFAEKKAKRGEGGGRWSAKRRTGEASLDKYHGRAACVLPSGTLEQLAEAMDFATSKKGVTLPSFVCEFALETRNKVRMRRKQLTEDSHTYEEIPVEGKFFECFVPQIFMQYTKGGEG